MSAGNKPVNKGKQTNQAEKRHWVSTELTSEQFDDTKSLAVFADKKSQDILIYDRD